MYIDLTDPGDTNEDNGQGPALYLLTDSHVGETDKE